MPEQVSKVELQWIGQFCPEVNRCYELDEGEEPPDNVHAKVGAFEERQEKKAAKLQQVRDLVSMRKESMINATRVKDEDGNVTDKEQVVKVKGTLLTSSKPMKAQKGKRGAKHQSDPDKEHDPSSTPAHKVTQNLTDEAVNAITQIIIQLEEMTKQLQGAKSADDMPLFTPDELMEEIWTPLIREGVIPQALIPAVRNRFDKLWAGANQLYYQRNKEFTRKENEKSKLQKVGGKVMEHGEALSSVAGGMAGAVLGCLGESAKQTKTTVELAFAVSKNGFSLGGKLLEKNLQGSTDAVAGVLQASVSLGMGKEIGALVGNIFRSTAKTAIIAQHLSASPPLTREAFDALASAVGTSFTCFNTKDNTTPGRIGDGIAKALVVSADITQITLELKKPNPNPNVVIKLMANSVTQVTTTVLKNVSLEIAAPKLKPLNDELKPITDKEKAAKEGGPPLTEEEKQKKQELTHKIGLLTPSEGDSTSGGAGFGKALESTGKLLQEQGVLAQAEKKGAEKAKEKGDEELNLMREQMQQQLRAVFAEEGDQALQAVEELYSIETLIQQVQADQAALTLAKAVLDAAKGVVTMIVPMLGGPLKAHDFAMTVVAATMRAKELLKWKDLVSDAKKAVNPQAAAFAAEVAELQHQLTNDILNAAFELAQVVSSSAGIAFPPAQGATAVVAAGQSIKTYIYEKIFKPAKIARAWSIYKAALKEPNNSKLKRQALKINPTLAKYAMAYGALEMNDAFAREALRACDLNDMVLMHKDTNAAKVAAYLELKLKDDIVVTGTLNEFVPAGGPALAVATWNKNKKAAAKKNWKDEGTANIDTALAVLARTEKAADEEPESVAKGQACVEAAEAAVKALESYKPVSQDTNAPHPQFTEYCKDLAADAARKVASWNKNLTTRREALALNLSAHGTRVSHAGTALAALGEAGSAATSIASTRAGVTAFCATGGGKALVGKLNPCKETPQMVGAVTLLDESLTIVSKRAEKADDDGVAVVLIERIKNEITDCTEVMTKQETEGKAEVQRLEALK